MNFRINSAVVPLLVINVVMYMLQLMIPGFTEAFMLIGGDQFSRPWILLTSMFLHSTSGFNHLLFNMYALFLFGPLLEQKIGPKRFLIVYLVSGIIAGFFTSFVYHAALGASAAIMGMLGAMIIILPNLRLLFLFFIPMPLWIAGIIWAGLDVFGIFFPSGVGNLAHLIGLATGLLYGLYIKKTTKEFYKKFKSKKHLDKDDFDEYMKSGRI